MTEAFRPGSVEIAGRTVVLIDDVVTTGATLRAAAAALEHAGAETRAVWTLTQTPRRRRALPGS